MRNLETEGITPAASDFSCEPTFQEKDQINSLSLVKENRGPLYKTLSAPLSAQVEVTETCNASCQHCYNYWRRENAPLPATLKEAHLLQVIRELIGNKVFTLTLTGGEPMLFKRAVLKAIETCTTNNTSCSLNSNLTTVTKADAIRLKEAGVAFILTSLISYKEDVHDSITHVPSSYKKTVEGIEAVLEAGIPLGVNMVITKLNQDHIYETGKFVASLGIRFFSATKAAPSLSMKDFFGLGVPRDTIKESLNTLLRLRDDFGLNVDVLRCYPLCLIGDVFLSKKFARRNCAAGVTTATIGADGGIRPCSHADEGYGNVLEEGLLPGWKRMNNWRDGSLVPEECSACEYLRRCTAGCRMEAKYYGDIRAKDPMATSPKDVIVRPTEKSVTIFDANEFAKQKLRVNPRLRFRNEDFGGILVVQGKAPVFVNKDAFKTTLSLRNKDCFSSDEMARDLEMPESEASTFFKRLADYGIVQKV